MLEDKKDNFSEKEILAEGNFIFQHDNAPIHNVTNTNEKLIPKI